LRELAVRLLLQSASSRPAVGEKVVLAMPALVRSPAAVIPTAAGGVVQFSRKERRVVELDTRGLLAREWQLPFAPEAVAVDMRDGIWVAGEGNLYRLQSSGTPKLVAELGDWRGIASLAVDGLGGHYLLERRGRIGHLAPGAASPALIWEDRAVKPQALVWDGGRLLVLDARSRTVLFLDRGGTLRPLGGPIGERPIAFAADPAGRLAVLDERTGGISLLGPDGSLLGLYLPSVDRVERPVSVGLGWDGSLLLLDAASDSWLRRS
jgi:hypothetical protein